MNGGESVRNVDKFQLKSYPHPYPPAIHIKIVDNYFEIIFQRLVVVLIKKFSTFADLSTNSDGFTTVSIISDLSI